jgi:hypothetical protein
MRTPMPATDTIANQLRGAVLGVVVAFQGCTKLQGASRPLPAV